MSYWKWMLAANICKVTRTKKKKKRIQIGQLVNRIETIRENNFGSFNTVSYATALSNFQVEWTAFYYESPANSKMSIQCHSIANRMP
jgi:hypothetical protein